MSYEYPSFSGSRSAPVRLDSDAEQAIARYGMDRDETMTALARAVIAGQDTMVFSVPARYQRIPTAEMFARATLRTVTFRMSARWSDGSVEFTAVDSDQSEKYERARAWMLSEGMEPKERREWVSRSMERTYPLSDSSPPMRVGDMVSINARGEAVRAMPARVIIGVDPPRFNTASGANLDALALASFGVTRGYGETDASLRARLMPPSRDPGNRRLRQFIPAVMEESHERFLKTRDALKQYLRDTQARNIARGGTNPLPLDARPVPLCAERPPCARVCESSDARCLTRVKRRRVKPAQPAV